MNRPTVSIVIPTYQAQFTLRDTLESIAKQEYQSFEILLMDGGSSDSTLNIAKEFNQLEIRIYSEKDSGIYDAMNKGIALAKGKYLYFMGSNDTFADPWVLKEIFQDLGEEPDLIFGHISYRNLSNPKIPQVHLSSFGSKILFKNTLHHQGSFYHERIFETLKFDTQYQILADYDFNLKLYRQGANYEAQDLIIAHCDASGISKQFTWELYREEIKMKKKHLSFFAHRLIQIPWILIKYLYKRK